MTPEQTEIARRAFVDLLKRQGFREVCAIQADRTYWKHRRRNVAVMLYRDERGQLQTQRL